MNCMLFGPTQPELVQPTEEERKLIADANERMREQGSGGNDDLNSNSTFSVTGACIAVVVFLVLGLLFWAMLQLLV